MATVRDILKALDVITGGRVITDSFGYGGANPFVVTKTSGIPGKAVTELPGLVWGDPDMPVKKVAVMMTLTESAIELAGATGIDCLIAHHPIAEAPIPAALPPEITLICIIWLFLSCTKPFTACIPVSPGSTAAAPNTSTSALAVSPVRSSGMATPCRK